MATKGFIIIGLGIFTFLTLSQTPRALESGIRRYLEQAFPGSRPQVRISAPLFWFNSGDLKRITVQMSGFDASRFPIPTTGTANPSANGPYPASAPSSTPPQTADATSPNTEVPGASSEHPAEPDARPAGSPTPGPALGLNPTLKFEHTQWARVDRVNITLNDFRFYGRHIQSFRAALPNVRYDFGLAKKQHLLRLGGSGQGTLQVTLSEDDLNQAVVLDRPDIRALRIHLDARQVRVTLEYHTILGWVPVTVTGQLGIVGGNAIYFTNPAISAVRVQFPQAVTDYILKRVQNLNPVFDIDKLALPMDVELTGIQLTANSLSVYAKVQMPEGVAGG